MLSPMVEVLAGRWVSVNDGDRDGLVMIQGEGQVTFVGVPDAADVRIAKSSDASADYVLQQADGEEIAKVRLESRDDGSQVLHLQGKDGSIETWNRTCATDGTPKVVPRKKGGIARIWTKEGQIGSPAASMDLGQAQKGFSRFGMSTTSEDVDAETLELAQAPATDVSNS